ncbi:MAG: aminopeptidase P family protein [Campylobacterota bacterium]|nr:aminopeptidase P family protein [Campylobacterota bacterium]
MSNYILQNENGVYFESGYSCDNVIYLSIGGDKYFITDARYEIEAKLFTKNCEVVISNDLIKSTRKIIKKSCNSTGTRTKIKKINFDPNDFTLASYEKLKNNLDVKFIQKPNFSKLKRRIKSDDEIKLIKKAMKLGRVGFEKFSEYLQKDGLEKSEKYLFFKAKEFMSNSGELDLSFDPIVAINQNSAKPHALPTSKILKNNDLLLVDAGVKYKRYCSDRTCTSSFNKNITFKREQKFKTKKEQKIYDIVLKAQQTAIEKARVGMKALQIDKFARDVIEKAGYGKQFVHSTGHGVGLDIHEYPNINSKSDIIIENNMVFTIEPGIYLNDKFGVRIEDTVVMKKGLATIL